MGFMFLRQINWRKKNIRRNTKREIALCESKTKPFITKIITVINISVTKRERRGI